MVYSWSDSEVDMWSFFMLREQYPMYATGIVHAVLGGIRDGFPSLGCFLPVVVFPLTWLFYTQVATLSHRTVRFALIFAYYQLMQLLHIHMTLELPKLGFLFIISSTILLVHCEVTPMIGTLISMVLIVKHFIMWEFVTWKTTGNIDFSLDSAISITWSIFHLWNYLITRKTMLISSFNNLQETRLEKERMAALLQSIPDGVLVLTAAHKVVKFNETLLKILNLSSESEIPRTLSTLQYAQNYTKAKLAHHSLISDIEDAIAKSEESAVIDFGSVLFAGKYLEWRGRCTHWNTEKACILTVRDVGEWVELESLAKKESAAKSALIRSVSHELRTPVNAIINISERLLETEPLSFEGQEECKMLVSSSHFLLSTVNDLLDFSRIANEKFSLTKVLFPLHEVVKNCVALITPQCRMKGVQLTLRYDSLIPTLVLTDQNRVKQVILNLLSNAMKFTLRGRIEVVVVLVHQSIVRISVQDTGIGIAHEAQSKIFTLFGQLAGNEKLNPQGCGLGLAISTLLVRSLGGSGISVSSEPGRGSIFSFSFPIVEGVGDTEMKEVEDCEDWEMDENCEKVEMPVSNELWRIPQEAPSILIADDSDFNRAVLSTMLSTLGHSSDEAYTGIHALDKIQSRSTQRQPYLIVLLDIEMPEMTGIEVAQEVRKRVAEGSLPFPPVLIGCSAYVSTEDQQRCLTAGMQYFLEKPVAKSRLIEVINSVRV